MTKQEWKKVFRTARSIANRMQPIKRYAAMEQAVRLLHEIGVTDSPYCVIRSSGGYWGTGISLCDCMYRQGIETLPLMDRLSRYKEKKQMMHDNGYRLSLIDDSMPMLPWGLEA